MDLARRSEHSAIVVHASLLLGRVYGFFEDCSDYSYHRDGVRLGTKNVGWLDAEHQFAKSKPSAEFLARLWQFCRVSVVKMRGTHDCELCGLHPTSVKRNDEALWLGAAEIRAISNAGTI